MLGFNNKEDDKAKIAELQAQLEAANKRNKMLEAQLTVLQKSDHNVNINQFVDQFNQELAKLPPFKHNDQVDFFERYNSLFVFIESFCIPVLKELKLEDFAKRLEIILQSLKQDAPQLYIGRHVIKSFIKPVKNSNTEEVIRQQLQKLVGCDTEKAEELEKSIYAIRNAERSGHLLQYVASKYDREFDIYQKTPDTPEEIAKWLEMMLECGNLLVGLARHRDQDNMFTHMLAPAMKTKYEYQHYAPHDYQYSNRLSNAVYDLLQQLHDKFGIDLSNMTMVVGNYDVCEPFHLYKPGISYDRQH